MPGGSPILVGRLFRGERFSFARGWGWVEGGLPLMPVDILGLPFRAPLSPRNTIDILRPLIDPSGWSFFLSTAGYLSMCGVVV
jgi:hypothetical protein